MDIHKNARLTVHGRERIVRQVMSGQTPQAVALAAGVCPRTIRKWLSRYRAEGLAGLQDRSSRPHRLRRPTSQQVVQKIEQLRRQRWTGKQIATEVGVSPATVSRVLRRLSLNKLSTLEPQPVRRYEREKPGELIHIDIKKLGRIGSVGHRITGRYPGAINRHHGIGWEFVHVCIDDASRIAFVQVMADQRKESAVAFLEAAVAYYAKLGVRVECVMTDNGSCYCSKMFRAACKRLGLRQIYTRPYTPKTNGKAERFIQTALREWAYAQAYQSSGETLELVDRQAEGDASKLPRLAAEIVAARPDVIACSGTTETSALRAATTEIPIVFHFIAGPLALGIVTSLAVNGLAIVWTCGLLAAAWLLVYGLVRLVRWIRAGFVT